MYIQFLVLIQLKQLYIKQKNHIYIFHNNNSNKKYQSNQQIYHQTYSKTNRFLLYLNLQTHNIKKYFLLITHISQKGNKFFIGLRRTEGDEHIENEIFLINKKVIKQILYLIADVLQLFEIILCICLILQIPSLFRRISKVLKVRRKEKNILSLSAKKDANAKPRTLMGLSHNILATMLTFCDVTDVCRFEMTCRKGFEVGAVPRVWRNLYEKKYKQYSPIPGDIEEPNYKSYCIEGYNKKLMEDRKAEVPTVSEETRDLIIGIRIIIHEELLQSLMRIPHLICLPIKGIAYLLYPLRNPCYNFIFRWSQSKSFHVYSLLDLYLAQTPDREFFTSQDSFEIKNFWRVQDTLLISLIIFHACIQIIISYYIMLVIVNIMRFTSGNATVPIVVQDHYNQIAYNQVLPPPPYLKYYYFLQILTFPIVLSLSLGFIVIPVLLWYFYYDYTFIGAIGGPFLVNILFFIIAITIFIDIFDLTRHCPHYNPLLAIYSFSCAIGNFAKDKIRQIVKLIFYMLQGLFKKVLYPIISKILEGVGKGFAKLYKLFIFRAYFFPLKLCVRLSSSIGIIGELVTVLIGIPWMLWPLVVPWYLSRYILFIPAIIISSIFIVTGRSILNEASKQQSNQSSLIF